jgi:hypothetical protein
LSAKQVPAARRQARWLEELQRYHIQWQYRPGKVNPADPLSRMPELTGVAVATVIISAMIREPRAASQQAKRALQQLAPTPKKRRRITFQSPTELPLAPQNVEQSLDPVDQVQSEEQRLVTSETTVTDASPFISKIRDSYVQDPWFADSNNTKDLKWYQNLWWFNNLVVVPEAGTLRQDIMKEFHDPPYSGHLGEDRTLSSTSRYYWWPGISKQIKDYVKHCPSCQKNKARSGRTPGLSQPLAIPDKRWASVSMDFIMSLPKTVQGHTAIMVMVDRMSKMVHLAPCTDTVTAVEAAGLFVHHVVRLHGLPLDIVSDRDPRFTSSFWKEICSLMEVRQSMSTAFHPQSDGQTERMNRVLEDMIRHYVSPTQTDWDRYLDMAEFAINDAHHEGLGNTPFMLNYGQHPRKPGTHEGMQSKSVAAADFVQRMHDMVKQARSCLANAQQRQKSYADKGAVSLVFKEGDKVLLSTKNLTLKGPTSRKLWPKWLGPFAVSRAVGSVSYALDLPCTMKVHNVFHVSLLKAYRDDGSVQPPPPPIELDGELYYEVERILLHRDPPSSGGRKKGKPMREFLVQWKGYGPEHNTWEPEDHLDTVQDMVQEYLTKSHVK